MLFLARMSEIQEAEKFNKIYALLEERCSWFVLVEGYIHTFTQCACCEDALRPMKLRLSMKQVKLEQAVANLESEVREHAQKSAHSPDGSSTMQMVMYDPSTNVMTPVMVPRPFLPELISSVC